MTSIGAFARAPTSTDDDTMHVTLEQARAFDALVRHGTFVKAASALRKRHTAVLYALRTLEEQTGLALLDRTGYRTKPTLAGARVLDHCRRLLEEEASLVRACHEMKTGWEPSLRIVVDGICDAEPLLRVVGALVREGAPTRIDVDVEFLSGVERAFVELDADVMMGVLPPENVPKAKSVELAPIRARLVAHRDHPLAARGARPVATDLAAHVLVSVRGSDPRLQLPTAGMEQHARVRMSDFAAKKAAILSGIGFGWMPEHAIEKELRRGLLREIRSKEPSVHVLRRCLTQRTAGKLGRAGSRVVDALRDAKRS
jgi:DNA-binding transcriptional LysR family regulator